MKAHEALISWSGWDGPTRFAGTVEVGLVGAEATEHFDGGGQQFTIRGSESLVGLFQDFQYLVVEENLDPEVVHTAFMEIDEYRALFSAKRVFSNRIRGFRRVLH